MGLSLRNIGKKIVDVAENVTGLHPTQSVNNPVPPAMRTPQLPIFQGVAQSQQQRAAQGTPSTMQHTLGSVWNTVAPTHVVNQVLTFPEAVRADIAAHTNNIDALNAANARLRAHVSDGKGLLNYQQTEHPTAANVVRGVGEGVLQIAPYVVGSGVGGAVDKSLAEVGANQVVRQVLKRGAAAGTNIALGTAANLSTQAAEGKQLSAEEAAKGSLVGGVIGAALPGSGKIDETVGPAGHATRATPTNVRVKLADQKAAEKAIDAGGTSAKATVTLKQAGKDAGKTAPPSTPPPKTPSVKTAPPPKVAPSVAATGGIPNTGINEVDAAIKKLSDTYGTTTEHTGTVSDLIEQAKGHARTGSKAARDLGASLGKNLTKEESKAVDDFLDGTVSPGLSAKALKVANAIKGLNEQAHGVRLGVDENIGKVDNYSTRIPSQSIRGAASRGKGNILGAIRDLKDIGNTESAYSQQRTLDKFVGKNDTKVGAPSKLGLKDQGNGVFQDAKGNVYKQAHATKAELEQAGVGQYEHSTAVTNSIYHGDTASLKARADALNSLKADPNKFGVYTEAQVKAGAAPGKVVPISKDVISDNEGNALYASAKDAVQLKRTYGYGKSVPIPLRAYDAATNAVTQAIVLNPIFHGMNQLYQTGIAAGNLPGLGNGWFRVAKAMTQLSKDDLNAVIDAGAGGSDYGSQVQGIVSKMTHGASKVNAKTMASIELHLRASLYKASVDSGMSSAEASRNINKFLGDTKQVNETIRRATLFAHYFKTMAGATKEQVVHPVKNVGANVNAVTLAAITAAIGYGYQKLTGNPNANVRYPGELGLIKEAITSGKEVANGEFPSLVTNRVNPVAKEGIQQVFNKDLFTGRPVTDTGRLEHAKQALVAPAQTIGRVTEGKRSVQETVANQLGLNTPHAKGYQAAPNVPILNTKGAITEPTGDPTGSRQQAKYFNSLSEAQREAASGKDNNTSKAFDSYLAKTKDPVTGQTISNTPSESLQNSAALADNDKLRGVVKKFESAQANHDPVWDLPDDKLKALMQYKQQYTGDAAKKFLLTQNPWITDVQKASEAFYSSLPKVPGAAGSKPSAKTPTYPAFDDNTSSLLNAYNSANTDQRSSLIKSHGAELSSAFNQIAQWTNAMRRSEGAPEKNDYPEADKQTQGILDVYNSIPKGAGRTAWIKSHPQAYSKMQNYLTQTSIHSLIDNAALAQFKGSEPNQQLLKDIKNVGQYDIATGTDQSGKSVYSVNPTVAYQQNSSSGSSGSGGSSRFKEAKYLGNAGRDRVSVPKGRVKSTAFRIKLKKGSTPKFKVASAKPKKNAKIRLKA